MRVSLPSAAGLLLLGAATCGEGISQAQEKPRALREGAYTEVQAARGKSLYTARCAACHGDALTGIDVAPALSGSGFVGNWTGKTAADLAVRIRTTMPEDDPGSLSNRQVADIVAYMLRMNRFPAGTAELPANMEELRNISMDFRAAIN